MKVHLFYLMEEALLHLALLVLGGPVKVTRLTRDVISVEGPPGDIKAAFAKMPAKFLNAFEPVREEEEEGGAMLKKEFAVGLSELQREALVLVLTGHKLPKLPKELPADLVDRLRNIKEGVVDSAAASLWHMRKMYPKDTREDAEVVAGVLKGHVALKRVTLRQLGLIYAADQNSGGLSSEQKANWLSKEAAEFDRRKGPPIGPDFVDELDGEVGSENWIKPVDETHIAPDTRDLGKKGILWRFGFRPVWVPNKKNTLWSFWQPKSRANRRIFTRMLRWLSKRPIIKVGRKLQIKSGCGVVNITAIPNPDAPVEVHIPWRLFFDSWAMLPGKVKKGKVLWLANPDVAEAWRIAQETFPKVLKLAEARGLVQYLKLKDELIEVTDWFGGWQVVKRSLEKRISKAGAGWFELLELMMLSMYDGFFGLGSMHIRVFGPVADAWRAQLHPNLPPPKPRQPKAKAPTTAVGGTQGCVTEPERPR